MVYSNKYRMGRYKGAVLKLTLCAVRHCKDIKKQYVLLFVVNSLMLQIIYGLFTLSVNTVSASADIRHIFLIEILC